MFIAKRNEAAEIKFSGLVSKSTGEFLATPMFAAGEVKVSVDEGAFVNVSVLPVQVGNTRFFILTLTRVEMDGQRITITFESANGEWETFDFEIITGPSALLVGQQYEIVDPESANVARVTFRVPEPEPGA